MLEAYLAAGSPCWRLFLSEVAENPEKWRVIQQSSPWSSGIYPWTKETLPETVKTHPGALETHPGALEDHPRALETLLTPPYSPPPKKVYKNSDIFLNTPYS
jgi:hypothetical protein